MAIGFSKNQLNRAYKISLGKYFPLETNTFLKKLIRLIFQKYFYIKWSIFNFRQFFYLLLEKKGEKIFYPEINFKLEESNNFKKNWDELEKNGYTFIRNFFEKKTHDALIKNFPTFNNFIHTKKIIKNYFYCFMYEKNNSKIKNIKNNPVYKKLFEAMTGEKFKKNLKDLINSENTNNYYLSSFLCTFKKEGSFLIPHMDGIFYNTDQTSYNFIYFIDGNNDFPSSSAGTGIYGDNDFKQPLLIPDNLTNSCLVYKSSNTSKFFHGFEMVKPGGFAKVITFEFYPDSI